MKVKPVGITVCIYKCKRKLKQSFRLYRQGMNINRMNNGNGKNLSKKKIQLIKRGNVQCK